MADRKTYAYRRQLAVLFCLLVVVLQASGQSHDTTAVSQFLDEWHQAAAEAKAEPFFQAIADDGIYIGTADFERWTKTEFENFAMPYFKKGKAWDFRPYNRDIHFSPDGRYAWFSELLQHGWEYAVVPELLFKRQMDGKFISIIFRSPFRMKSSMISSSWSTDITVACENKRSVAWIITVTVSIVYGNATNVGFEIIIG